MKRHSTLALAAALLMIGATTGCERKEKVLEVDSPGLQVDVERNVDTGEVEVNVDEE
ncbi:hypothetical protein Pla123a_20230 [Posidoniimonas polymericola]|uniref:Uncharacterized protein n=1 Tax=Posidoniimonas polymericola TaxID=2528002 RepID=A0A5C5YQY8_9BACT|nr:hypothetical protein [Posidoniimonas polymericola]TWT77362.1 hypothetical protein Pla123a_20230 [Posidoniimonas polymericola]